MDIEKNIGFPSDFVNPSKKEKKEYGLTFAKAIYSKYYHFERTADGRYNQMIRNRKYAEGLQSVDQYKDALNMSGDASYANLDWSVIPIIPNKVDALVGEFLEEKLKLNIEAIDPISKTKKDKKRAEYMANMALKDLNMEMKEGYDIEIIPEGDFIPESEEEIDLEMDLNYKDSMEVALEKLGKYIIDQNDWDEIKRKLYRDLVVLKKASLKVFLDSNDNVRIRYVDPFNLITSYSEKDDFSDIKYAGELVRMDISKLRQIAGDQLSEEELFEIAKKYSGRNGNRQIRNEVYYDAAGESDNGVEYDDFLVDVLDFEFISMNTKNIEINKSKSGKVFVDQKGYNYKQSKKKEKEGSKLYKRQLACVYSGMWVVGTESMVNYGKATDILYPKKGGVYSPDPKLNYVIFQPNKYEMTNKSLVERMIPDADGAQRAALMIQNIIMKTTPNPTAIDVSALKDVFLGKGVANDPLSLIEIYRQTGFMFYNGETEEGQMNRNPIQEIQNSMGPLLQQYIAIFNNHINNLSIITGINPIRDASTLDKDAPVKTQAMVLKSSRNATNELNYSFEKMFNEMSYHVISRAKELLEQGRAESWRDVIGVQSYRTLNNSKELWLSEYGIYVSKMADTDELLSLEDDIQRSLNNGTLMIEDAIRIRKVAKENINLAYKYMILRRKKYDEREMQKAQMNAEQNAMIQQQSMMANAQAKQAEIQSQMMAKQEELKLKYMLEDQNAAKEHERLMERLRLEGMIKSSHIDQASEENLDDSEGSKAVPEPRVFSKPQDDSLK